MSLHSKLSTKNITKPQASSDATSKSPLRVKLTLVTPKERKEYRVPVYDYIL